MLLMEEAERIALEEHGSGKIAVISGDWRDEFMIHLFTFHTWHHNEIHSLVSVWLLFKTGPGWQVKVLMLKPSGNFWEQLGQRELLEALRSSEQQANNLFMFFACLTSGHGGQQLCLWEWSLILRKCEQCRTWVVGSGWVTAECSSCPFHAWCCCLCSWVTAFSFGSWREEEISLCFLRVPGQIWKLNRQRQINRRKVYKWI